MVARVRLSETELNPAPYGSAVGALGCMDTTKQTLKQALQLAQSGKDRDLQAAAQILHGLPVGGWPETQERIRQLRELLPGHWARDYTTSQFIDAAYRVGWSYGSRLRLGRVG